MGVLNQKIMRRSTGSSLYLEWFSPHPGDDAGKCRGSILRGC